VAVVPLLDDGRLVLVRQYRYPVGRAARVAGRQARRRRDPAGLRRSASCARRPATPPREWASPASIHNAAAYSTESIELWFARGLEPGPAQLDDGEFVETVPAHAGRTRRAGRARRAPDVKT
jgi:ADP-ribose pyrophosphatase